MAPRIRRATRPLDATSGVGPNWPTSTAGPTEAFHEGCRDKFKAEIPVQSCFPAVPVRVEGRLGINQFRPWPDLLGTFLIHECDAIISNERKTTETKLLRPTAGSSWRAFTSSNAFGHPPQTDQNRPNFSLLCSGRAVFAGSELAVRVLLAPAAITSHTNHYDHGPNDRRRPGGDQVHARQFHLL
jgi:hypothetical protein